MVWDLKKEVGRKVIHILSLIFLLIYYLASTTFSHKTSLFILAIILIILLKLEFARIELGRNIPIVSWFWQFKRTSEKHTLGGEIFFLIGAILSLALFDLGIATAAILMTTFGDLAASVFGKRFGKTWVMKDRALEGIGAELVVNILIGYLVLGSGMWIITILMAITATIVETIVHKLDDNLLIPLFAGFVGEILLYLL